MQPQSPTYSHDNSKMASGRLDELRNLYSRMREDGWRCPNENEFSALLIMKKYGQGPATVGMALHPKVQKSKEV